MSRPDIHHETIYSVLTSADTRPRSKADWLVLSLLGALAWIGAAGYLGQFRNNDVARALHTVASGNMLLAFAVGGTLLVAVRGLVVRSRALIGGGLVVAAFLLGNLLYALVTPHIPGGFDFPFSSNLDAVSFAAERLAWSACLVVPMLLAWRVGFGRVDSGVSLTLGLGNISALGRETSLKRPPSPWHRLLFGGYALACALILVSMQAPVAFGPFRSGTVWPLLPGIALAAVANATAEEYIFRGVMQPTLMRVGGIGAALWVQGALFGLMHWGLGAGILAALPVSLAIGYGSVIWGKAAYDTGGMAWVIVAHTMIDVAIMCALFVPTG